VINQQIQNYTIISLLGEGGMANVYLAQHQSLGNNVAVKLLKEEFVQHPNIRKRFLAEARSLAKMNHPNVIKVTDLIDAGDIVAFVMEYIEGQTLEDFLSNSGKLPNSEIENMFSQMILAVEYVHSQGLIHRDIKPSNFMVTKGGQIKLLDFGIAKNTNESAVDYTKTGLMQQMGTPLYMSPEQVRNTSEITEQSDIYSLGVVLWQLVMNKKPYDSVEFSLPEIQVSILKEPLPLTHTIWDSTIQDATEKDPTKRFLKINSKKDVESKSNSETIIDKAQPITAIKEKASNFKLKIASIGLGILFLISVLVYIVFNGEKSEIKVVYFPETPNSEIVVPSKKMEDPTLQKENPKKEPKQVPSKNENPKEIKKEVPIVTSTDLTIGQKHQGGIIFYIDNSGKHGKICSIQSLGEFTWNTAKFECESLALNGYSDWYLPSRDDLNILCSNKKTIPNMKSVSVWSSTINVLDENYVWGDDFNYCSQEIWHISTYANTFAVRKF
jgi:serine/threonine-protein kinase